MVRLDSDEKYRSSSRSARLRRKKVSRSSAMPATGSPLSSVRVLETKSCSMTGMASRASVPSSSGRTGTGRQPRIVRSCSAAMDSTAVFTASRVAASVGRKALPTA